MGTFGSLEFVNFCVLYLYFNAHKTLYHYFPHFDYRDEALKTQRASVIHP